MVSPLSASRAVSAAIRREPMVGIPCRCVGAPATIRSVPATSTRLARVTGTKVTSWAALSPAAMSVATACVFPYIDS